MAGYTCEDWNELHEAASGWINNAHLALLENEQRVCEQPDAGVARYRNVNFVPGVLQTVGYVDALCRGAGLNNLWITRNYISRLTRQKLLREAGVRQEFLVSEPALINWPGDIKYPVEEQLLTLQRVLKEDMTGGKHMDFRIIPSQAELPEGIYEDTFCLYETPGRATGFKEPWNIRDGLHMVDDAGVTELKRSWNDIGSVALDRHDSLDLLAHITATWNRPYA